MIDKKILLRLLETTEAFLKKKATIGQLREAAREARKALEEA
jgi:hypothetical protein